jgi:hypothetical protein
MGTMILRMTTTLRGVAPNSEDFRAGWDLWKGQPNGLVDDLKGALIVECIFLHTALVYGSREKAAAEIRVDLQKAAAWVQETTTLATPDKAP